MGNIIKITNMKKLAVIALAALVLLAPSCKNQNKKTAQEAEPVDLSSQEAILKADLQVNLENLMESAKKMKPLPFVSASKEGKITLSNKEKAVKPDFLLNGAVVNDLVTLSQKYRACAMLGADLVVANLYEMPATDIKDGIAKALVDISDPALEIFAATPWGSTEDASLALEALLKDEYEADRANFFWESAAASMVEQLYIVTRDIDKFMPMFDDESAADVTFNFICVHEGIMSLMDVYPELQSLNTVMEPLYVINAISAEQLKEQLTTLKGSIEGAREALLK